MSDKIADKKGDVDTPGILVVANGAEDSDVLCNILVGKGYRVDVVTDHSEAATECRRKTPELVIFAGRNLDEQGLDVCKRLTLEQGMESVPVLVVCDDGADLEWMAGFPSDVDYITRPYVREKVLSRVRNLTKIRDLARQLSGMRDQLLQAQKMECVGALASGVVHEFNNLMFAVMGFAELAKDGTDINALRESAEVSYETAKRATATAASLLAFSRQAKSDKSAGRLNDAVSAAVRLLKHNLEKSGVVVNVELGELPEMKFAFGPIQQVFLNLIINAWHAMEDMPGNKVLTLTTRCESGGKVVIEVSDTGKGIPKEMQEKIFEPFVTTKHSHDGEGISGSGLGLSIVKEVLRDHDGSISVKSQEGKGSTFTVFLPVFDDEASGEDASDAEDDGNQVDGGPKYSILIVDDEEANRKVISRLLARRGYSAYSASNMAEALAILWSRQIDLVTMDMVMPQESGISSILRLREMGIDVPILICTGHVGDNIIKAGMDAGANGFVTKPFSAQEFLGKMAACLGKGLI